MRIVAGAEGGSGFGVQSLGGYLEGQGDLVRLFGL